MKFVDPAIENYCIEASSVPSPLCEELADYTRANIPMSIMLSGPLVGSTLQMLITAIGAKRVVEVGCYTGYSALAMAEAVPAGGTVETFDVNPETLKIARNFWNKSPHGSKIREVCGDSAQTLKEVKGPLDFVFLDANKTGYVTYFDLLWPLLRPGGMIVGDNCLYGGQVVEASPSEEGARAIQNYNRHVMSKKDARTVLLPVRDGLMIASKIF